MPITFKQAKQLKFGDMLYCNTITMADGKTPARWRVNGKVKTWKRDPYRLEIPLKYGLYNFSYLCHGTIANRIYQKLYSAVYGINNFELTEEEAIKQLTKE